MAALIDLTRDLKDLAELATDPAQVEDVLLRALEYLEAVIPYDLAAVLELTGNRLVVRTARGRLANQRVRDHELDLDHFATLRRALETRQPRALVMSDHAGTEGDPYDGVLNLPHGHACMVVPLYAGQRTLGALTFDQAVCQPYDERTVELAGVYGQIISLALLAAEQAALLQRLAHGAKSERKLLEKQILNDDETAHVLERSRNAAMQRLVTLARSAAPTDVPVLIFGETGSGKEVVARALHAWSARNQRPFITLNCAALPENLVESEMFGHVRGAFSGAEKARDGRFVTANGGTLFLDEIGDLPLPAQAKLLRVLQEGTFEPVGSDKTVKVDVRIIAATHVDLESATDEKRFREDLLYRLNVFPLHVPALRDRAEDIPALAGAYLAAAHKKNGRGPWTLSADVVDDLVSRPWPGNVRELINVLERQTILSPPGVLTLEHEPLVAVRTGQPSAEASLPNKTWQTLAENERAHIERALVLSHGRIYGDGGAAERLAIHPSTLLSRIKRLGVKRPHKSSRG